MYLRYFGIRVTDLNRYQAFVTDPDGNWIELFLHD